eukprot:4590115-Amphidinium_carterae.1
MSRQSQRLLICTIQSHTQVEHSAVSSVREVFHNCIAPTRSHDFAIQNLLQRQASLLRVSVNLVWGACPKRGRSDPLRLKIRT